MRNDRWVWAAFMLLVSGCDDAASTAPLDAAGGGDAVLRLDADEAHDAEVDRVFDAEPDAAPPPDGAPLPDAEPLPVAEIRAAIEPWVEAGWLPSVSLVLIRGGITEYVGFGWVGEAPPDADTIYELGSITKTFTGLLLADAVERGEATLDDPIEGWLPAGVVVPARDGTAISLGHLVTHRSGLPHFPDNLPHFGERDREWEGYTEALLYTFLADHVLARAPGEAYAYSNLGAGLLAHGLALQANQSYADLLRNRVTEALGMPATGIGLGGDDFATPHHDDGRPALPFDMGVLDGAGALRSSARDMATWLHAWLDPKETPLSAVLRRAQAPLVAFTPSFSHAYHWFVQGDLVWHGGATYGSVSFAGFVPSEDVAVALLANGRTYISDALAMAALSILRGRAHTLGLPPATVELPPERLAALEGTYRYGAFEQAITFTLSADDGRLSIGRSVQPPIALFAEGEADFHMRYLPGQVHFEEADGEVTGFTLSDPTVNQSYFFRRLD